MPILKKRYGGSSKAPTPPVQTGTSPFFKGFKTSQKESEKGREAYKKEIMFGGKKGFPADARLSIAFRDEEPLSYYAHNMFSIGKAGFLTCAAPADCRLCVEGIQKVFKSAWRVFLIDEKGNIEMRYLARGNTELQHIAKMADAVKGRCSKCGDKMLMLGGKLKCTKHRDAPGSQLSDWIFELYRTGEGTSTKWLFDRDRLIDTDLRANMDAVEDLDLEKILAPKNAEYLKKVLADLHLDKDEEIPPAEEEAGF